MAHPADLASWPTLVPSVGGKLITRSARRSQKDWEVLIRDHHEDGVDGILTLSDGDELHEEIASRFTRATISLAQCD